jgi:hypothetical protein
MPAMANGRCWKHGGKSLGGIAAPTYKHGLYSKYVPKTLRRDHERILKDHDLTELREELAVLTLRIADLIGKLEDKAPPWEAVQAKWRQASEAEGNVAELLAELDAMIAEGVLAAKNRRAVWKEIRSLIQEKTRTASAEWSRLRDLQGLVPLDKVMGMWRGVLEAIRIHVLDPVMLRAITADVLRFMPPPSSVLIESEVLVKDNPVPASVAEQDGVPSRSS